MRTDVFTEEYFIRGLTLRQIGEELGLPQHRLKEGAWICFALELPVYQNFRLGGWAEFSTDNFVTYDEGKMKWSEADYEETYAGKRLPVKINNAKRSWLSNMRKEKLVKILPAIPHSKTDAYPKGGKASQVIIMKKIRCYITKFPDYDDIFRGVW